MNGFELVNGSRSVRGSILIGLRREAKDSMTAVSTETALVIQRLLKLQVGKWLSCEIKSDNAKNESTRRLC